MFDNAVFSDDVFFTGSTFAEASFENTTFSIDAHFDSVKFEGQTSFDDATFSRKARFDKSIFSRQVRFDKSTFSEMPGTHVNFMGAEFLNGTTFEHLNLRGADFRNCDLKGANFEGADLEGTLFEEADLAGANLLRVKFNSNTSFSRARVEDCKVDRYSLECLENRGRLTVGALMTMKIRDDVATLRSSYGGYLQWVHIAALVGFLFPYLWFVVIQWGKAQFLSKTSENFIPLWQALLQFIYGGGENWEQGFSFHWSFTAFGIALFYNILRAILFWKTKQLELTQESSGLPVMFSMDEQISGDFEINWRQLYVVSQYGIYLYLAAVILNLGHFFTREIPVGL